MLQESGGHVPRGVYLSQNAVYLRGSEALDGKELGDDEY